MEASPEPSRPPKPGPIFLDKEVLERHLQTGMPVEPETARWIWLMNHALHLPGDNPETTEGGW